MFGALGRGAQSCHFLKKFTFLAPPFVNAVDEFRQNISPSAKVAKFRTLAFHFFLPGRSKMAETRKTETQGEIDVRDPPFSRSGS